MKPQSDCRLQAARVKTRHSKCLASIPEIKIEKLIRIVQEAQGGREIEQILKKIESEFAVYTEEGLSLNRVSDRDLARQKQLMELTFEKNKVGIDHPDFVYDKKVEFGEGKEDAEWDKLGEDEKDEEKLGIKKDIQLSDGEQVIETGDSDFL